MFSPVPRPTSDTAECRLAAAPGNTGKQGKSKGNRKGNDGKHVDVHRGTSKVKIDK